MPGAAISPAQLFWGIVLVSLSGNLLASLVPLVVGQLIQPVAAGGGGYAIGWAGALQAAELTAIALGAALAPRVRWERLGIAAVLVGLSLAAASLAVRGAELFAVRVVAGAAVGLALGTAMARIGETRDPERVYTVATICNALFAFASLYAAGQIAGRYHLDGIFVLYGLTLLPGLAGVLILGKSPEYQHASATDDATMSMRAWLAAAVLFLLNMAVGGAFAVLNPVASGIGADEATLGLELGLGPLAGILAILGLQYLVPKRAHMAAAVVLLGLTAVLMFPLLLPRTPVEHAVAIVLQSAAYYAAIPPILAAGTAAGPTRQAAPALASAIVFGTAVGPAIGGALHDGGALALAMSAATGAAAMLLLFSLGASNALILRKAKP